MNEQKTEIVKLLNHKQETCARLLEKVGEQMKAVDTQDDPYLAVLIEDKESLIAGLNETDQKIADLVRDLDQSILESLVRENEGLAHRIESDLAKIIEQETVCQEKISLVKTEVLEKIKAVKKGQTLLKGYGSSQRNKPNISRNA